MDALHRREDFLVYRIVKPPSWWPWKKAPPVVTEPARGRPTEIEEADVQSAYIQGLLQGELRGRLALIHEIEMQFSPNTTQEFDAEAAKNLRLKQLQ